MSDNHAPQIYFSDKQLLMNQVQRERYVDSRGLTPEQAEKIQLIEHVKFWQVQAAALAVRADSLERDLVHNAEAEMPCIVCHGVITYRTMNGDATFASCSTSGCVSWGMTPAIMKAAMATHDIFSTPGEIILDLDKES
jgi:hypothetical protein